MCREERARVGGRRLRENAARAAGERRSSLQVVFHGTREIEGSIVFATLIIFLVFVPLFFLTGVEGRLLEPLGFAYVISLAASLLVALTVTRCCACSRSQAARPLPWIMTPASSRG
jgi:Cu/Ag efflux pump CusA